MRILRKAFNPIILASSLTVPMMVLGASAAAHASEPEITSEYSYSVLHAQTLTIAAESRPEAVSRDNVTVVAAAPKEAAAGRTAVSGWSGTVDTSNILSIARSFIGQVPYIAGGANPDSGFDCSGFTQYVYGLAGVQLPHSSILQGEMGQEIPYSEAREGDLLIWYGHVAIYAGNGMIVDASVPGTMISEHPVWGSPKTVRL